LSPEGAATLAERVLRRSRNRVSFRRSKSVPTWHASKEGIMGKFRWQDAVMIVAGLWIAVSPWMLGFDEGLGVATWNAVIVGLLIVVLAAVDLDAPARWEEAGLVVLGIWAMLSPPLLGMFAVLDATVSMMVSGALVVLLAGWELFNAKRSAKLDEHAPSH
jgi:hypothetical protein